jgi:hypothetical protein
MGLKPGQFYGTELPNGVGVIGIHEIVRMMNGRPGFCEALELCQRADKFEDGTPIHRHAVFEVRRGTRAGRNIAKGIEMAEKILEEKRRYIDA